MSQDPNYPTDREFGQKFMPQIKPILGQFLLTDEYDEEDTDRNTDLITLTMANKRIGVRGRRYEYFEKYPYDFTIRYQKESGCKTEFAKVMEGWGDYFFYFFSDPDEEHIIQWLIGDYNVFRIYVTRHIYKEGQTFLDSRVHYNRNHDTFLAFNKFAAEGFVVASSDDWSVENVSTWIKPS